MLCIMHAVSCWPYRRLFLICLQYGNSKIMLAILLSNWTPPCFDEASWTNRLYPGANAKMFCVEHTNTHRRTDVCLVFAFLWALCFSLCCLCLLLKHKDMPGWRHMCLAFRLWMNQCKPIFLEQRGVSYLQLTLPVPTCLNRNCPRRKQLNQVHKISCWKPSPCERLKFLKPWQGLKS